MRKLYNLCRVVGIEGFSKEISTIAPYFSTIDPMFVNLKPEYAEFTMPSSPQGLNHIGSIGAVTCRNAAKIIAWLMTDISIEKEFRGIPAAKNVQYSTKVRTDPRAIAFGEDNDWKTPGEKPAPGTLTGIPGLEVCAAGRAVLVSESKE